MSTDPGWRFPFAPTTRQAAAAAVLADETFYGGAAGGGKTDWIIASHVTLALLIPGSRSVIFRRTFPDLERSIIPRMMERIPPEIARYNGSTHTWTFRNGSRVELGHLQHEDSVLRYQGAEYQLASFDELTQFTEFQYTYILSRLRAAGRVRDDLARRGLRPRMQASGNPGGPGHHWVKARFIDPAPPGRVWRPLADVDDPNPGTRVYVPARVSDNPHLDESYADRLGRLDETLRRALLDGDWDILEGVRFSSWRRKVHVVEPEELPVPVGAGVPKAWGVDYGMSAPFCALAGAKFADGLIVIYREIYQAGLTPIEQAAAIAEAEPAGDRDTTRPIPIALDSASWARPPDQPKGKIPDQGDVPPVGSIARAYWDRFASTGGVHKSWKDRLTGWALIDEKLRVRGDGLPRLLVHSTCTNLIRTLPALPRDRKKPEDVDTTAEDHAADALRYLLGFLEGRGHHPQALGRTGASRLTPPAPPIADRGF